MFLWLSSSARETDVVDDELIFLDIHYRVTNFEELSKFALNATCPELIQVLVPSYWLVMYCWISNSSRALSM